MRKFIALTAFFTATPLVIFLSLVFALFLSYSQTQAHRNQADNNRIAYAALPTNQNVFDQEITSRDGRIGKLTEFFNRYGSPLKPEAEFVVAMADEYGLDYRLIPAIAMQESNLCKKIPHESFNCWGFGIYGGKVTRFENYKDAIEAVTKTLATKYKGKGLVTPNEIMSLWTPSSNGSWADGV